VQRSGGDEGTALNFLGAPQGTTEECIPLLSSSRSLVKSESKRSFPCGGVTAMAILGSFKELSLGRLAKVVVWQ
jgi:hypothetical protein